MQKARSYIAAIAYSLSCTLGRQDVILGNTHVGDIRPKYYVVAELSTCWFDLRVGFGWVSNGS